MNFRYKGSKDFVLNNINYTFEQGKVYLIVGENGAGKTTLIQLLSHLYEPYSGEIKLNNIPINNFNDTDYKSLFSIVFQDFKYFAFTIAENVALDSYEAQDNTLNTKINMALDKAGLKKR